MLLVSKLEERIHGLGYGATLSPLALNRFNGPPSPLALRPQGFPVRNRTKRSASVDAVALGAEEFSGYDHARHGK